MASALDPLTQHTWAVVMAGGQGARLGTMTHMVPKPMLKVGGRPILERIIGQLAEAGIGRIFVAVHHQAKVIEDWFADGSEHRCRIEYLREPHALDTAGALNLLPQAPPGPVLVMNGDLIVDVDLRAVLRFHRQGGYGLTMAVSTYVHHVPFGVVEETQAEDAGATNAATYGVLERSNRAPGSCRVLALNEKPTHRWSVSAGIYAIQPELLHLLPKEQSSFPMTALIERCLQHDIPVGSYRLSGRWIDVGTPSDLHRARQGEARELAQ